MIMVPDFITTNLYDAAFVKACEKRGKPQASLRLGSLVEGLSLQTLHVGRYDDEDPILAELHNVLMPSMKFGFNGKHHEIYLSDPRKTYMDASLCASEF